MEEHHAKAASAEKSADERSSHDSEESAADGRMDRREAGLKPAKKSRVCCLQEDELETHGSEIKVHYLLDRSAAVNHSALRKFSGPVWDGFVGSFGGGH